MRVIPALISLSISVVFLFSAFSIYAGSVFMCKVDGVTTFSQTPCDEKYEKIDVDVSSATPESRYANEATQQECLDLILRNNPEVNPNTARVMGSETKWINDKSGARQLMTLKIYDVSSIESAKRREANEIDNAKGIIEKETNRPKSYQCFLNHDGTKPSRIQRLVN